MYLRDIINKLRTNIPNNSDNFCEKTAISSASYSTGVVTIVTSSAHGLSTGDIVNIVDCKEKIAISSITTVDNIATCTTADDHNLTLDYDVLADQPEVEITDCSISDYNGSFSLASVSTRTVFSFDIETDPSDATDGYFLRNFMGGYNGLVTVTVVNSTTFTYTTTKSIAATGQGGYVNYNIRISGGVDISRLELAYSKQSALDYWMFVVPADTVASKSRHITSDPTQISTVGDDYRQRIVTGFDIYMMLPSTSDPSGRQSYDAVIEESVGLFKSLLGTKINSPYSISSFSTVVFESHGYLSFNGAYYSHRFSFSITDDLVSSDIATDTIDVAFRDINAGFQNSFDEVVSDLDAQLDN